MTTTYLLDDIETYIVADVATNYTFGTNLFAGLMPDTPDKCSVLFEYEGGAPDYVFGASNSLPAISYPHLQVVSRDTSYAGSRTDANTICALLEGIVNQTINGTFYFRIARLQDPFFMHRDKVKNRVYFACNYEVFRQPD